MAMDEVAVKASTALNDLKGGDFTSVAMPMWAAELMSTDIYIRVHRGYRMKVRPSRRPKLLRIARPLNISHCECVKLLYEKSLESVYESIRMVYRLNIHINIYSVYLHVRTIYIHTYNFLYILIYILLYSALADVIP